MSNTILRNAADGAEFNENIGRGIHAYETEPLNITTRYIFDHCVRWPSSAAPTFVDLGCGSGEALVQALLLGFRRPVIGIDWDKKLLTQDTRPKLQAAGYVRSRDFILLCVNLHAPCAIAIQEHLCNVNPPPFGPAPPTFDVVYSHKVWSNTLPALRPRFLANCIALGKAGGKLYLSFSPRYAPEALPPQQSVQQHNGDGNLSPTAGFFTTSVIGGAPVQTVQGLRPQVRVMGAIAIAPQQQWVDAETQARAELAAVGLNTASATFLRLGTGQEFGLAAGPAPPGPQHRTLPYGFTANYRGCADWSAHWTSIALARQACCQPQQSPTNRNWNLMNEAEEMVVDVISHTSILGCLFNSDNRVCWDMAVEVMATINLGKTTVLLPYPRVLLPYPPPL